MNIFDIRNFKWNHMRSVLESFDYRRFLNSNGRMPSIITVRGDKHIVDFRYDGYYETCPSMSIIHKNFWHYSPLSAHPDIVKIRIVIFQ